MINDKQAEKIVNEMFDAERLVAEVCQKTVWDAGPEVVLATACRRLASQLVSAASQLNENFHYHHQSDALRLAANKLALLGDELDQQQKLKSIYLLAAIIRKVDGNHQKGAVPLAEAILSDPDAAKVFGDSNNG